MAALGSVVVELSANIAKFQSDMGKAAAIAEQNMKRIDDITHVVTNSLKALGIGLSIGATIDAIESKISGAIDMAAGLQQLSERTGASATALAGFAMTARLSNTSTDDLAVGLQKLSKSMIDAENGGTKTGASFAAIGISTDQLKGKKPDEVFKLLADRLNEYQDGAEKTVVAQNLLGKSGANLLPMMKDMAELGIQQVNITTEQIAAADELRKNQERLALSTQAIYTTIAMQMVPAFDAFVKTLLDTENASDGVRGKVNDLAKDGSIKEWAENAAKAAAFVIDAFDGVTRVITLAGMSLGATAAAAMAVAHGEGAQAVAIQTQYFKDVDALLSKTTFSTRLQLQLAQSGKTGAPSGSPKPSINGAHLGNKNAYNGPADDPTKKLLEGQLKAQEDFITSEKTQLQSREQMLDFYHGLEYSTLRESETQKQQLIADNLKVTEAAYDKEAAAIRAYIAQAAKQTDKADGQNKLADVASKRAAAETQASQQMIDSQLKLETVKARFNLATQDGIRLDAIANSSAQFQIDMMGKNTLEVMKATEARNVQLQLDERIRLLRKDDPNVDTSGAIAAAAIQTAQAQALIVESYNKQRDAIFGAGEALRKYQEDATNTGQQVQDAMANSFKGMEDALTTFVTTGKLSFKSLADSIVADITRIIIKQQLASALGGTGSGGAGDFLTGIVGKLFGGGAASAGLGAATAADVASAGSGLMFFANGGEPPMNRASVVGENGPELFVPKSAGTIIPNSAFGGGSNAGGTSHTVNLTMNVPKGTDTKTAAQWGAAAARQLRIADARNN